MRLTVCLEGNAEGRVLASVDMEEIVKMTITDDIEKSNFNPQMLKSCTDTSYECGYEQGATDMEKAKQIIIDNLIKQIDEIRADVIDEIMTKAEKIQIEQIECLNQSTRKSGKMWARYMNTYLGHIQTACKRMLEQLKEHN